MPFRPEHSLLKIDVDKMHTIDTRSVENLFGMWSVFSKVSNAMEDGKRLENLSWRLWNRETFCCCPDTHPRTAALSGDCKLTPRSKDIPVPALSSSVSSDDFDDDDAATLPSPIVRPELRRNESGEHRSRGREKHITPNDLEKMVISIKEKKSLEPLPTFPLSSSQNLSRSAATPTPIINVPEKAQVDVAMSGSNAAASSKSSGPSDHSNKSQVETSQDTTSLEIVNHNVVRGFTRDAPSSYRSQTHLPTLPTPILKTSASYRQETLDRQKKKGAMFTLGGSSEEDESSLDSHMGKNSVSSISSALKKSTPKPAIQKHTSFKDVVMERAITESPVFEDSEEDEDDDEDDDDDDAIYEEEGVSESAIEDEDSDWEDDVAESGPPSAEDKSIFRRVDSRPDLTSRRSLLTTLMHEPDRARALAAAASRSTPSIRRSRATSPSGPSAAPSSTESQQRSQAQPQTQATGPEPARPTPIIMTTSNTHQAALSPRTTRRHMLSTELTESLRKNLLWERQHKSSNNLAAMKRRHTSHDMKNLKQYPEPQVVMSVNENDAKKNYSNDYFHHGLQEYHTKGW